MNTGKKMNQRHDRLISMVKKRGYITVKEMSNRLDVSTTTIRKDITFLDQAGYLSKCRGGACPSPLTRHFDKGIYTEMFHNEKNRIAKAVTVMIDDDSSLFIDVGTTSSYVAKELVKYKNRLKVVTNNLEAAAILSKRKDFEVFITGGIVPNNGGGMMGESVMEFINQFKVDVALIGSSGLDHDGSLLTKNYHQCHVPKMMIKNSRVVYLALDHTQFGKCEMVRFGNIQQIDTMITDRKPPINLMKIISNNGVSLIIS
ncbi:MAG: DeoR/GlpR family DNA-binding transcription regulator [Desulfobacterales bacterium]|nr:DeoR/GlpR family DNA-binding transcription regulator [Desulfobacterales bacterium]